MSSIPEEIYFNILLRVPVKSTFVCKCVCKTWLSLISAPDFAKLHFDFTLQSNISSSLMVADSNNVVYSINHDSSEPSLWEKNEMCYPYSSLGYAVEIVGSSNGLICLMLFDKSKSDNFFFCVWNPATHEFKNLSKPTDKIDYNDVQMCAFDYDHKGDDYKLVIGVNTRPHSTFIHVFTIESDSWRSIITLPYEFISYRNSGALVNGDLHFVADGFIVSLNINEERFKVMEWSTEIKDIYWSSDYYFITAAVLQGYLCVLLVFRPRDAVVNGADDGDADDSDGDAADDSDGDADGSDADDSCPNRVEVWVMQDYGVPVSWTKRYTITNEMITGNSIDLRFIPSFENGKILFMVLGKLVLYDPKDGSAIERDMDSESETNYFESLVSVNSGTYVRRGQIATEQA